MSSVIVQIGQCGNQVGHQFWKHTLRCKESTESSVYVHGDGKLRSLNVDSEPKVLAQIKRDLADDVIRDENFKVGRRGRGTNWALGYYGTKYHQEDRILEETMEALRKETERCSSFSGVILMHSLSGGTGSGLGSHLTETIRDEYPMNYLLSSVVAPHLSGESPLQHYNSLLCLSWLQRYSDSIMLFHNDEVLYRMEKRSKRDQDSAAVSFTSMNRHIGACLAGVFMPTDSLVTESGYSVGLEPWEMVRSVCPMSNLKFLHVNHLAKSKLSWDNLSGVAMQSIQKHSHDGRPYKSLSNLVVARGDSTGSFPSYLKKIESRVKAAYHCVDWNPFPVDFWIAKNNPIGPKDSATVTMVANYSNVIDHLDHVIERANQKFSAKAYLHWYEKHGCEQSTFEEAFDTLQTTIQDYREAVT